MLEQVETTANAGDSLYRRISFGILSQLQHGQLQVIEGQQRWQLGQGQPQVSITIHHHRAWRKLLLGGSIGMAEAYRDGLWDTEELTEVIALFSRNLGLLDKLERRFSWLSAPINKFNHWRNRNSKANSRKNIAAHYDLSNDFYKLFLDQSMLYSSALFSEAETLEQAQFDKLERLCQQLQLRRGDHLLEIGTGWGALALHAASHYGCHVTTTTISDAQYQEATARVAAAGLTDQITLLKQDYRDLHGQYDKIVSVEMIEAVGEAYLDSYFEQLQALLKPGGLLAIQAITIADQRYDHYRSNVDFIQTYIFPGGFLPSLEVLSRKFKQRTSMVVRNVEDIGLDYGHTLGHWRARFEAQLSRVRDYGFDEAFIRLWRFYFCYCQAGFETRRISAVQLTAEKDRY
ncbi:SAM-dependent methyltransferase [Ferrimonas senticii]|uniref:SAM-dependent methyltransferase n=1 Tax=Ferrimonas senticii TaxID=394566 RepID=UPI0004275B3C|nr:cyclopropane-fatty-acyl-phospholipid synthase family protein [Ferrimonas senticii]